MQALLHPTRDQFRIEAVLEALAHPVRLRIVQRLADGEELTCGTVLPDVPRPAASHHWRVLRESGILFARKEGRTILHTLRRQDLDARFPGLLDSVLRAVESSEAGSPAA
ncbi:ArsR/SmtB family transcription factor [Actinomadura kijaniata]|uniref:ArsR/SmtB family transcription factor n=1 Tax=Actinomadura kijaniata TaxID=46161 RepID=UPI003F1973A1